MRCKSKCFEKFKEYGTDSEKCLGKYIKTLRSHYGGKHLLGEFKDFLAYVKIIFQLSAPEMPQ